MQYDSLTLRTTGRGDARGVSYELVILFEEDDDIAAEIRNATEELKFAVERDDDDD
jgi:hypothetical protein